MGLLAMANTYLENERKHAEEITAAKIKAAQTMPSQPVKKLTTVTPRIKTPTISISDKVIKAAKRKKLIAKRRLKFLAELTGCVLTASALCITTHVGLSTLETHLSNKAMVQTIQRAEEQRYAHAKVKEAILKQEVALKERQPEQPTMTNTHSVDQAVQKFTQGLQSKFTQQDREVFAKMIYGEAGYGADPFEVGHVALNRLSAQFGKTLTEVITAKGQFDGYNEKNPIDKDCLAIANQLIAEYEANGCKKFCNYYYFYTHPKKGQGLKYNRNIYMSGAKWVPFNINNYSESYCSTSIKQSEQYYAERDCQNK